MHGGGKGSGARAGNRNALKTGLWTARAIASRRQVAVLLRAARAMIQEIS
jgi:hypothetical protein